MRNPGERSTREGGASEDRVRARDADAHDTAARGVDGHGVDGRGARRSSRPRFFWGALSLLALIVGSTVTGFAVLSLLGEGDEGGAAGQKAGAGSSVGRGAGASSAFASGTASASVSVPSRAAEGNVFEGEDPDAQRRRSARITAAPGVAQLVDDVWLVETAEKTGIPVRALAAYAGASIKVSQEVPGCGLGWNTLAAIGFVESAHGTIDGSVLNGYGDAVPAIIGVALNGSSGVRSIPDTDAGQLDGDAVWDRALGPMQFIPGTWNMWGADGNGDGVVNVQNIDDSALAAARYLCAAGGGDLARSAAWIAAVAAYNDSLEYNNRVARVANRYAEV